MMLSESSIANEEEFHMSMIDLRGELLRAWECIAEELHATVIGVLQLEGEWDASFFGSLSNAQEDALWDDLQQEVRRQNIIAEAFIPALRRAGEEPDKFTPAGLLLKSGKMLTFPQKKQESQSS